MSLINQMLKDLEARSASQDGESKGILKGLSGADVSPGRQGKVLVSGFIVLVMAVSFFYIWKEGYYKQIPYFSELDRVQNQVALVAVKQEPVTRAIEQKTEEYKKETGSLSVQNTNITNLYDDSVQPLLNDELENVTAEKIQLSTEQVASKSRSVPEEIKPEQESKPSEFIKKDKPLSHNAQAEVNYQTAVHQLKIGHFSLALQSLKDSLNLDNKHIAARDLLANLLVRNQRMDEALVVLSDGIDLYPYQLEFVQLYARVLAEKGLIEPALQALERISPDLATESDYHALRATLYQKLGRYEVAIKIYQDVLRIKADKGRWWMGLALSLESQGDLASAQKAYRNAMLTSDLNYRMKNFAEQKAKELEYR
ncbi:MAG: tetratricopeptide repeat protein [Gammaproteobacteria bacterium]|nr:tetratricopeptide repeat protein [Gammaproteobacteria bacterium]